MTPARRDWRSPAAWEGYAWTGVDPWSRRRDPLLAQNLAREVEKARRLDLAIKLASMHEYRERLKEFRRLRAVGVRCKPPTHYSRTFVYRQAAHRLASPKPAATRPRASTPPHDPARPGIVIRRPFGRVIDVY